MDFETLIILLLATPIILGAIFLFFGLKKSKKLSSSQKSAYRKRITQIASRSPSERMIAYDAVLDHILKDLGYTGNLGEKLKKRPPVLSRSIDEIWRLHKIRNQIAHEMHASFDEYGDPESFESILLALVK